MKRSDPKNMISKESEKFSKEINSEMLEGNKGGLVSYAERALRARIAFTDERLTILNSMILKNEDYKLKEGAAKKYQDQRAAFDKNRATHAKSYVKMAGSRKVTKSRMAEMINEVANNNSNDAAYARHC